jgi:acid phosphatase (class A)
MRRLVLGLCALVLLAGGSGLAKDLNFLSTDKVELLRLLAPPPAPQSEAQRRDLAAVLEVQSNRTPERVARAVADSALSIFRYDDVLGPNFTPDRLPLNVEFFKRMHADARTILNATKEAWNRPRPFNVSADVKPLGEKPRTNFAYPSGTTIFGSLTAIMLANMVPEKRVELFDRSVEYAANRIVLGIHYPTDIEAGRIAAAVMAAAFLQNPAFMAEFDAARAELRRVLELPPDQPLIAGRPGEGDVTVTGSVGGRPAPPPQ